MKHSDRPGFHSSSERLFGINHRRLLDLKNMYDPQNMFRSFVDLKPTESDVMTAVDDV